MARAKEHRAADTIASLTRNIEILLQERRPPKSALEYIVFIPIERHKELVKIESDRAISMARDCGLYPK